MDKYQEYHLNHNLQQSNNFLMIIEGDEKLKTKDFTFYLKNFPLPDINISKVDIPTLVNHISFPSQGKMDYGDLVLELLLNDGITNYLELVKWVYRIKNPVNLNSINRDPDNYFLTKPSDNNWQNLQATEQYPIEYRDINVLTSDTNGQFNYRFNFAEAWPFSVSGLQLNSQKSDYLSFTGSFEFLVMTIYDAEGNRIV